MTAPSRALRPCPGCSNPTPTRRLLEVHLGPTRRHPRADVVWWLCAACTLALARPLVPEGPR